MQSNYIASQLQQQKQKGIRSYICFGTGVKLVCDFFLYFRQDFRTNSMYFETIVILCFLWTRDCLGVVIDSQFSFVGWQDHSIVSLLPMVYTQSPEGSLSTSILCASRCFQTNHCHVYYVCRYGLHKVIVDFYIYSYQFCLLSIFFGFFHLSVLLETFIFDFNV